MGRQPYRGLAARLEEALHERSGFVLEEPSIEANASGKELRSVKEVAELRFACPINNTLYPRPKEGTGTHRAGLYRDIEGAVGQVFPSEQIGCRCDGLHLGMGCHVVQRLCQIVCPRYDAPFAHHYRPNGDFTFLAGCFSFL